jgi:hypothetical protein
LKHHRDVIAPKSDAGTRPATQLDPLDALLMTSALYEVGDTIERARIPASEGIVHSFRFCPAQGGQLWDPLIGFESFVQRTRAELTDTSLSYVAQTDISSFYHRISLRSVAEGLERIGVRANIAQALHDVLRSRSEDGLPVGPSFTALLTKSTLI